MNEQHEQKHVSHYILTNAKIIETNKQTGHSNNSNNKATILRRITAFKQTIISLKLESGFCLLGPNSSPKNEKKCLDLAEAVVLTRLV